MFWNIFAKNIAEKIAILTQITEFYDKNQENTYFLSKNSKNRYYNNGPSLRSVVLRLKSFVIIAFGLLTFGIKSSPGWRHEFETNRPKLLPKPIFGQN
jgi:hypothetical protein